MTGIVPADHAYRMKREALRREISDQYAAQLTGADRKMRKQIEQAIEREIKEALALWLKQRPLRKTDAAGFLIH